MTDGSSRTFDEDEPLKAGAVVSGVVVAHHPWGPEVMVDEAGISGIVEITKILDDRPYGGPADLPEVGSRVSGVVVLGYTPAGQLRLSLLRMDAEAARGLDQDDA